MKDFKSKVQKIIDEEFIKEPKRPDLNMIKQGYFNHYNEEEHLDKRKKKNTFEIDISMKGIQDRIQLKDKQGNQSVKGMNKMKVMKNINDTMAISMMMIGNNNNNKKGLNRYHSKGATQPANNEIEIKEITKKKSNNKGYNNTHGIISNGKGKNSIYKDIISSLDPNQSQKCSQSKVKREIDAYSNSLKEASLFINKGNHRPTPMITSTNITPATALQPIMPIKMKKIAVNGHNNNHNHSFSLLNRASLLEEYKSKNRNKAKDKEKSMMHWTKKTSIDLYDDNQSEVDEFSKSFDTKISHNGSILQQRTSFPFKMKEMLKGNSRMHSEGNLRDKLLDL